MPDKFGNILLDELRENQDETSRNLVQFYIRNFKIAKNEDRFFYKFS